MTTTAVRQWSTQLRAEIVGDGIRGHAAVFGQAANLGNGSWEEIGPNAFDGVLERSDVRALVNHDPAKLLARQGAGTLLLDVDDDGLVFDIPELPDTSYAHDLRVSIERGDIDGASFGFIPGPSERRSEAGRNIRTHTQLALLRDVSPVTFQAYGGTDVVLRAMPGVNHHNRSALTLARVRALLRSNQ